MHMYVKFPSSDTTVLPILLLEEDIPLGLRTGPSVEKRSLDCW